MQKEIQTENSSQKQVFSFTKMKKSRNWSKSEDKTLLHYSKLYNYKNWNNVAKNIPGRTPHQCSARFKSIRPGVIKGTWSDDDDKLLVKLVKFYGKNWCAIAKKMSSRTGKQIRERYINVLDPNVNKTKFSEEEDNKIVKMYLKYGPSWSKIAKSLKNRTCDKVKNRFYSCLSKKVKEYNHVEKELNNENIEFFESKSVYKISNEIQIQIQAISVDNIENSVKNSNNLETGLKTDICLSEGLINNKRDFEDNYFNNEMYNSLMKLLSIASFLAFNQGNQYFSYHSNSDSY